jgi:hypothetical protein
MKRNNLKDMKTLLFTLLISFTGNAFSQSQAAQTLLTGWERIYVRNVGFIDMPSNMEVQSGTYQEIMNSYYNRLEIDAPQLVFQQKGLNSTSNSSFQKYGRVILETQIGSYGDFQPLSFNISTVTASEISELNQTFKQKTTSDLTSIGHTLIEWYPLKVKKVNGLPCIHVSYKRQLGTNPIVLVNYYIFQNNDRMHSLTLSYRVSETSIWKTDFDRILSSFRITNVK